VRERLTRAWATVLLATIVAAALVGLAFMRGALGDGRDASDRAKNERILARLEPPAGARVQTKTSGPSYESIDDVQERRIGYATDLEYNVPKGVSQREVVRNYDRQLRGWKRREQVIACEDYAAGDVPENCKPLVLVQYTRGRASVSLNIDGYGGPRPWGYELTVIQRDG
jgi:hypothetical protein